MSESARVALALVLAVLLSVRGYRRRSLSLDGACLAFIVGLISCAASLSFGLTLIIFFLSSSKVTRLGAEKKRKIEDGHQVGGNRNWVQVLANGGIGTALAGCFWLRRLHAEDSAVLPELGIDYNARRVESWLQAAYLCHYACCNADTWASELGVLSTAAPILITQPWRIVPAGTNGGVTWSGTAASVAGGLVIGLTFWGVSIASTSLLGSSGSAGAPPSANAVAQWPLVPLGALAGGVGSLIDSLLGATLQYSGWSDERGLVVETPSAASKRICGCNVLDNHQVNFLAAALTSALGAAGAAYYWPGQ